MVDEYALLEQFVRIPSPSYHEHEVAQFLVGEMQRQGFEAFIDGAGNAIGLVGDHGPLVALLGHIDTVGGDVPVRIDDGILYGRGTVDAKGPFATFLCAAIRAAEHGTLSCRVVLIGAVEEEAASSKGAHYAVKQYQPDYCIIGEPSGWNRVTLGYKGRLLVHYTREQPSAHSAGELRAAPEHLVNFWLRVEGMCASHNEGRTRLFDQMLPSLRYVHSESDGLSDHVAATIGLRLPEDIDPHMLASDLTTMAKQFDQATEAPGTTSLRFEGACPAFRSTRTTPLASAFVRAVAAQNEKAGFVHKTGTSDMNVAGPAWRCPIVAYGPGDSSLDHTPNEHISLAEYQRSIAVVTHVLEHLS